MKYDFADAKENTEAYVSDIMSALSSAGANTGDASRFQTE